MPTTPQTTATRLVASALLGLDAETVTIGGKAYTVHPPTIERIAGAALHLTPFASVGTLADAFNAMGDLAEAAEALSWFINGDGSLKAELAKGTLHEVTTALAVAVRLMDVADFSALSALARNVSRLTAKPKL